MKSTILRLIVSLSIGVVVGGVIFISIIAYINRKPMDGVKDEKSLPKEQKLTRKTAGSHAVKAAVGLRSWDMILNESDMTDWAANIKRDNSYDFDYAGGQAQVLGGNTLGTEYRDSGSEHKFSSALGDISIKIQVFKKPQYAEKEMQLEFDSDTARFVQKSPEGTTLKKYAPSNPKDTLEANPFLCTILPTTATFGDQSFCSQWKNFSPKVHFRLGEVVATVSVGAFGTSHLTKTIEVAHRQEEKLSRLLGGN